MRNPVQKMLKAGSQMKNNPALAKREEQSPNPINSFAAKMVIPEQQAMQKSKPIPYPVGSVLMQKLAQAQQAALAAQQPSPREGGIAQMAAKGGVLKFAEAGEIPKRRGRAAKTSEYTNKPKPFEPAGEGYFSQPKPEGPPRGSKAETKRAVRSTQARQPGDPLADPSTAEKRKVTAKRMAGAREYQQAMEQQGGPKTSVEDVSYEKRKTELARRAGAEDYSKKTAQPKTTSAADAGVEKRKLELARRAGAEDYTRRTSPNVEQRPSAEETAYERRKTALARRAGAQDYQQATSKPETPKKGASESALEKRLAEVKARSGSPDYRAQGIEQAASQKARRAGIMEEQSKAAEQAKKPRVSSDAGMESERQLRERTQQVKDRAAADKTAALEKRKADKYAADKAAEESGAEPKKVSKEAEAYRKERLGSEARVAESTQKGTTFAEEGIGRRAAVGKDVKRGSTKPMTGPMTAKSPATFMDNLTGRVKSFFSKNPDMMAGARKVAQDVIARNPEATMDEIGAAIKKFATPEAVQALEAEIAPVLEKHGMSDFFNRTKGGIQGAAGGVKNWAKTHPGTVGAGVGFAGGVAEKLLSRGEDATMEDAGEALVEGAKDAATGAVLGKIPVVGPMYNAAGALMPFYEAAVPEETQRTIARPGVKMIRGIEQAAGEQFDKYFPGAHAAESSADKDAWLEKVGTPEGAAALDAYLARKSGEAPSEGLLPSPAQTPAAQAPAPQAAPSAPAPQKPQGGIAQTAPVAPAAPQGGIAAAPQAPAPQAPAPKQDLYAGDTSEGTPQSAISELMGLQGPGYQYSPEVMGMLKDAKDEERGNTLLKMIGMTGAGLANRNRYEGAHDAALLATQAFTSGTEREDEAQKQFLQGIIHNEQVPFEQRAKAYNDYVSMQKSKATNEALMARAGLSAEARRYAADQSLAGKAYGGGSGQNQQYKAMHNKAVMYKQLAHEVAMSDPDKAQEYLALAEQYETQAGGLAGLAGDEGLGQTTTPRLTLDAFK